MSGPPDAEAPRISVWEWLVAALGLLALIAALWMLLAERLRHPQRPPDVSVRVVEVARVTNGWLVRVEAANAGDETAASLRIEGTLTNGEAELEKVETELDFLPGRSTRRAGLFLQHDPGTGRLVVRATSYQEP